MRTRPTRGFTLMEMAVTLAIACILGALAFAAFSRGRTRGLLAGTAEDLQALLHQARQSALASGVPVSVLVYPAYSAPSSGAPGVGYVIVYQDACFDFFTATAPNCGVRWGTFNPASPTPGANGTVQSEVIDTIAFPNGVILGVSAATVAPLAAPLNTIPVTSSCSFCGSNGGAVQFDSSGGASFYRLDGSTVTGPLTGLVGGSLNLTYDQQVTDATGQRTIIIQSTSGIVDSIISG